MRLLQIVLTIISLKHPHQAEKVSTQANLPLLGFKTPDEVVSYLDAVIRSGTSADEKSGTVFLMGNTAHHVLSCPSICTVDGVVYILSIEYCQGWKGSLHISPQSSPNTQFTDHSIPNSTVHSANIPCCSSTRILDWSPLMLKV